ncbi:upstream activation factor subunit spp27-like isoform X1 [Carex littledalei]|uniref:Upstream activation factor subunit spp27-like isoform X1 n=1 Tax=Carex littledalei TaxID=544730 RepID=A0A833QKL7_9POAL|nr:upstream activation factor subunit spp27-like isoform X1 [Carex littledalei]
MATDEELTKKLKEFLRSSDLSTTSTGAVRRHLEAEFATDLSHKKAFIREQVELIVTTELSGNGENEAEQEEIGEGVEDGDAGNGNGEEEEEEEDGEEDEEEEQEPSGNSARKKRRVNKSSNKEEKKRGGGGFTKLCSLSPELQDLVGETTLARTEVVKRLWVYIREKDLQDPKNRKKIICDEKLKKLFNVNAIDMFQMNKALTKHIWPLEDGDSSYATGTSSKSKEKEKPQKKEKKSEGKKTCVTGLMMPLQLSEELVNFLGTGETSMARSAVIKHLWTYIKENDLQDPSDRRNIICDEKLKDLFKVESFNGFSMARLLIPHFIKE